MIYLDNDNWAQYDNQIGTFRAEIDGVIYGLYTNDIKTAAGLAEFLTPEQITDLQKEKV